jgi:hypothetical protein
MQIRFDLSQRLSRGVVVFAMLLNLFDLSLPRHHPRKWPASELVDKRKSLIRQLPRVDDL